MNINNINLDFSIPAYCINLDRDTWRWQTSQLELPKTGFYNLNRMPAVNAKQDLIDLDKLKDAGVSPYTRFLLKNPTEIGSIEQISSVGSIGCTLSHGKCWQQLLDLPENVNHIVVFEDDLHVSSNAKKQIEQLMNEIMINNIEFDLFSFGYITTWGNTQYISENIITSDRFFGTQAYIISRNGATKLLNALKPIEVHVDSFISFLSLEKEVKVIMSKCAIVYDERLSSSIGHIPLIKPMLSESCIRIMLLVFILLVGIIIWKTKTRS